MTTWQPPEGYTLTVHPAHQINTRGFGITGQSADDRRVAHPGGLDVFEFDEDEPFVWRENDGTSVQASPEAPRPLAGSSSPGHSLDQSLDQSGLLLGHWVQSDLFNMTFGPDRGTRPL